MLTCFQIFPVILQKIIVFCELPTRHTSKSHHPKNSVISQKKICRITTVQQNCSPLDLLNYLKESTPTLQFPQTSNNYKMAIQLAISHLNFTKNSVWGDRYSVMIYPNESKICSQVCWAKKVYFEDCS